MGAFTLRVRTEADRAAAVAARELGAALELANELLESAEYSRPSQ